MTAQEKDRIECAIRHIKTAVDVDPWAAEIAVEAMRKELSKNSPKLDKENGDLQPTCNQLATDTISRQAAIDALHTWFRDGFDEDRWWNSTHVLAALEGLPSAQPEPQWIPVSERLPEDGTDCLVSSRCSDKVIWVDRATYSTDLFTVDKEDFIGNRGESGWYCYDREYGYCKVLNVLAWMPLPEPYRAERRTDEGD